MRQPRAGRVFTRERGCCDDLITADDALVHCLLVRTHTHYDAVSVMHDIVHNTAAVEQLVDKWSNVTRYSSSAQLYQ